ncbi:hypothetical protein [Nocardia sp. CNY236]|uniref:hypothetical protein n=1 Tax=Nocardia sp. CNY236 TaxID=1169152 RepID=UPI00048DFB7A|nr:hypothetical protein [Nocardia sp. CNY236]
MNSPIKYLLTAAAVTAALVLPGAPQAMAYPVGPWGVEGSCPGVGPRQCPFGPSEDGLTWSYRGASWNYDKTGAFVCGHDPGSSARNAYCSAMMTLVRALPPLPIGELVDSSS